eukprot:1726043-Alexandrium_andersonii.AAC.1
MAPPGPSSSSALARRSPLCAGVAAGRGATAQVASPASPAAPTSSSSRSSQVGGRRVQQVDGRWPQ